MKESALRPTILKFGLTGGLILSLQFLIFTISGLAGSTNRSAGLLSGAISMIITIGLIIFAIKQHRDQVQDGYITLGQCVLIGTGVLVFAALISGAVSLIYTNVIDPGYMERISAKMEEAWEAQGLSEDQIEQAKKWTGFMKNPFLTLATTLACYAFGGAIISLIVGLIMKKEKPEFS
jgi:hypothetical protein